MTRTILPIGTAASIAHARRVDQLLEPPDGNGIDESVNKFPHPAADPWLDATYLKAS